MFWKKNEKQNWIIFWTFLLTCYTWNKYKLENEISFLTLGKTTECEFGNFNSKCSKSNSKEICLAAQNGRTNLKFAFINKHYMQILILTGKNLWRRHHSPVHISVITENILLTIIRYARYHPLLVSNRIYVTDSQYWGTIQIWWNLNEQLLTVCYYLSRTSFRVNPHSIVYLNFKELLARNRRHIWSLSDSNDIRTHNHLVCKRTLNHLAKLAKWKFWPT